MGQTLEKPIIKKDTFSGKGSYLSYGCSSMQGYRLSMEDQHSTDLDIDLSALETLQKDGVNLSFFGVYDGHSGQFCAKYLAQNLLKNVLEYEREYRTQHNGRIFDSDDVIKRSYVETDQLFNEKSPSLRPGESSGSTCCTVYLVRNGDSVEIICANVGDSRAVMRYGNGKVIALSEDHKPTNLKEKKRILESGGTVDCGRVNGSLALSRAFGDVSYKLNKNIGPTQQAVIALPDIIRVVTKPSSEDGFQFLIVACDGIWDVMHNEFACEFVAEKLKLQKERRYYDQRLQKQIELWEQSDTDDRESRKADMIKRHEERQQKSGYDLESIAEDLLDEAVLRLDSKDNVSVIIVLFEENA